MADKMVALLRGINVGGKRIVPMAELRAIAEKLGFGDVETYIQSGNLIFSGGGGPAAAERALEQAIEKRMGFFVDVLVREAATWKKYAAKTPFPDAAQARPNLLHLALCKQKPGPGALTLLRERATTERIELAGDALWIDFKDGVARSKITPALLDRAVGSCVTARNYKTVQILRDTLLGTTPPKSQARQR
jgi:uncharacterized protein (DUF1697 family)